jgi:hypothetical protein
MIVLATQVFGRIIIDVSLNTDSFYKADEILSNLNIGDNHSIKDSEGNSITELTVHNSDIKWEEIVEVIRPKVNSFKRR